MLLPESCARLAACVAIVVLVCGCAGPRDVAQPAAPTLSPGAPPAPDRSPQPGAGDAAQQARERAVAEAARSTGARPDEVQVVSVEQREWGDTSLGCPQPGQVYAQVMTGGFLVRVRSRGTLLEYHVSAARAVLCP